LPLELFQLVYIPAQALLQAPGPLHHHSAFKVEVDKRNYEKPLSKSKRRE
jgi:hypothetical protein